MFQVASPCSWLSSLHTYFIWPSSSAPHYLADMCQPVSSVDARRRLRSAAREDLVIPRSATKFGALSFTIAAPSEWNRLPQHIRSKQLVNSFKVAFKSYLFTTDSS